MGGVVGEPGEGEAVAIAAQLQVEAAHLGAVLADERLEAVRARQVDPRRYAEALRRVDHRTGALRVLAGTRERKRRGANEARPPRSAARESSGWPPPELSAAVVPLPSSK